MNKTQKTVSIEEISNIYHENSSIIVAHYHGLSVDKIRSLRRSLKQEGADLKVIKNTLAKIAANRSNISATDNLFKGPVAIAYSSDPVTIAKVVHKFAKDNESLKIVGGILDNKVIDRDVVAKLSTMPSLNEIRGKIVGVINAPATKIACILSAPASQIARVLNAYSNK
ncbi:MAG: 50S ribosomal protein L10 [Rickettsiaceae bacterium]|nr:50S ribosomal protein L10 [Rickettsiaceae bacterium]